jgi:hypothetical protein
MDKIMSGGHFDYKQCEIRDCADQVQLLIHENNSEFPDGIIEKFKEAAHWLARSSEMLQRIDWLVSGDDGIESFLKRWEEEVRKP